MTISSETSRVDYDGNGSTTAFSTGFQFLDNDHVVVVLQDSVGNDTVWTEGTQYTLTGAGTGAAGTVTVSTSPTDYTPASGARLIIYRDIPNTNETDYPTGGRFPSDQVERDFDLAAMRDADQQRSLDRTLRFPDTDDDDIDGVLPSATQRADGYLKFDSDGNPTVATGVTPDDVTVSAFAETLLDDTTAADMRTTLGLAGADLAHTVAQTITVAATDALLSITGKFSTGGEGPTIKLFQDSASPAGNDTLGGLRFSGRDDGGNETIYGRVRGAIVDPTNTSEDGEVGIGTIIGGTLATRFRIGAGVYTTNATGGDKGADSMNASAYYDDGVALPTGVADAAAMETPASATLAVPPSLLDRHPGVPKFWVKAGTTGNSLASRNLTGLTDTGTGQLTATIATDFSSADWCCKSDCEQTSTTLTAAGGNVERSFVRFGGQAAGTVEIDASDFTPTTNVLRDPTAWHVGGLGDQ